MKPASPSPELVPQPTVNSRTATLILSALAVVYGFLAGLATIGDPDLGWHMATGRWILQNHAIPWTDVLSHTARGHEWIYPLLSQVIFYGLWRVGGYAVLSLLAAVACAGTILILLRSGTPITALLALLAVPMIAARTRPRADMFTEILFALFLVLLWSYHRTRRSPLWLLPVLMGFWVNLHPGFILGLAACGAYFLLEFGEFRLAPERKAALSRLRKAAFPIATTFLVTLLNPWGPRIYLAFTRQNEMMRVHGRWIAEWFSIRLNSATLAGFADWRDPRTAVLWLLAATLIAVLAALYTKKFAAALILAVSSYLLVYAMRFQGPFAVLAVVIGGAVISDALSRVPWNFNLHLELKKYAVPALLLVAAVFVAIRSYDLVTSRYYLRTDSSFSRFGLGESPLYPNAAASFLKSQHLPPNLLNDFNAGGSITWTLGPTYLDYIDGRSIPFGPGLFLETQKLLEQSPDSDDWRTAAEHHHLNTAVLSLDYEIGTPLPFLDKYCFAKNWRPVFLDPYGVVLLRVVPETSALINRFQIDCATIHFDESSVSALNKADQFRYYLNAASVLIVLDRTSEALAKLDQASRIFTDNAYLHYARGAALQNLGHLSEAAQELETSVKLGSDDAALSLARQYDEHGQYADEARVLAYAAERSLQPHWLYVKLGYAQLELGLPRAALASFDSAEKYSPFINEAESNGETSRDLITEGRQRAEQILRTERNH